ncbi:DUF488 family protein [Gloeocapsa sp. PCC 73106]|uniref:DUF488 domain-containing protein n=1 Tax=Gloeocapsa sp. PCC 73106 TaxID=102232 RepID=UPI0002ACB396|nr:DUF488 domain-containing protein [Gloeocapsa sp. PCC 73106]ELR99339.1 hypothetical protein GLO73106DRAFT_00031890 [Gloeocapsa sp. PCC 73106]
MQIYTIGHSNLSQEQFISLLNQYEIKAIADVRSQPYSRYLPHFSQKQLQQNLLQADIEYLFLGKQLGGRPTHPDCYRNGKVLYDKVAETNDFAEGIATLLNLTKKTAVMCSEKDPINCHRAILICQHLKNYDREILHILNLGKIETQTDFEARLLKQTRLSNNPLQLSLFEQINPTSLLKQAYQYQGEKIAYQEKKD